MFPYHSVGPTGDRARWCSIDPIERDGARSSLRIALSGGLSLYVGFPYRPEAPR